MKYSPDREPASTGENIPLNLFSIIPQFVDCLISDMTQFMHALCAFISPPIVTKLFSLTSGSDSKVLGGCVSLGVFFSSLGGPMLGGGRWKSLDWSCCALGQGRVPLTHSTGSSQTAFCPWAWFKKRKKRNDVHVVTNVTFGKMSSQVFTLMPSLAPSCRYGMIEWFHRSMNHCLNSATDTGHDRKKQGPEGGKMSY